MIQVEISYEDGVEPTDDDRHEVYCIVLTSHGSHEGWQMTTNDLDQVVIKARPLTGGAS